MLAITHHSKDPAVLQLCHPLIRATGIGVDGQHRAGSGLYHLGGHAADEQFIQPLIPMGAHNNEVGLGNESTSTYLLDIC